jgi:hypothetical protein
MKCAVRKLYLAMLLAGLALVTAACGVAVPPEDIPPMTVEAQSTPETSPVSQPEPTETNLPAEISVPEPSPALPPEPAPTSLPNEISEPRSPVVPPAAAPPPVGADESGQPAQAIPGSEAAVAAAVADLSKQTGVPADQITVDAVEPVEWPDASLGCPQEGMMYAQVITPGYLIVLSAQGQTYEYHADQRGNVVLCSR